MPLLVPVSQCCGDEMSSCVRSSEWVFRAPCVKRLCSPMPVAVISSLPVLITSSFRPVVLVHISRSKWSSVVLENAHDNFSDLKTSHTHTQIYMFFKKHLLWPNSVTDSIFLMIHILKATQVIANRLSMDILQRAVFYRTFCVYVSGLEFLDYLTDYSTPKSNL